MPLIVVSLVGIWAVFELVRRLVSRRAGLWTALVLATSAQWALITRQAMTDMPFVAPMTVAVCFCRPGADPPEPATALWPRSPAPIRRRSCRDARPKYSGSRCPFRIARRSTVFSRCMACAFCHSSS